MQAADPSLRYAELLFMNTLPAPLLALPLPGRALLALGLAVSLAHVWLLQAVPATLGLSEPPLARALVLRSISPSPAAQATVAAAVPAAQPQPQRKRSASATAPASPSATAPTPALPLAQLALSAEPTQPEQATPSATLAIPSAGANSASPSLPVNLPGSARIKYDVTAQAKGLQYQAEAELLWRHDGNQYDARLDVSALFLGTRTQTSQGRLGAAGLLPVRFSNKSRSEQAAHFDYDTSRIRFSANTPDASLQIGAQDRLSVVLQLAALLAGEPALYPAGSRITLQTVGPRDADIWVFVVGPGELLSLPGGELATVKLTRQPRREFDIKVELWLAPAQNYLPVRTLLTQSNGDFVDQLWRSTSLP